MERKKGQNLFQLQRISLPTSQPSKISQREVSTNAMHLHDFCKFQSWKGLIFLTGHPQKKKNKSYSAPTRTSVMRSFHYIKTYIFIFHRNLKFIKFLTKLKIYYCITNTRFQIQKVLSFTVTTSITQICSCNKKNIHSHSFYIFSNGNLFNYRTSKKKCLFHNFTFMQVLNKDTFV